MRFLIAPVALVKGKGLGTDTGAQLEIGESLSIHPFFSILRRRRVGGLAAEGFNKLILDFFDCACLSGR